LYEIKIVFCQLHRDYQLYLLTIALYAIKKLTNAFLYHFLFALGYNNIESSQSYNSQNISKGQSFSFHTKFKHSFCILVLLRRLKYFFKSMR